MKAAIFTIYGQSNYGNRFQNYGVFSNILKLGIDCESIISKQWTPTASRLRIEAQMRDRLRQDELEAQQESPLVVRQIRYETFDGSYIPQRFIDAVHMPESIRSEYDFFITGSDQVWNPQFRDSLGQIENRLLKFARPEQRVCFAPSFGIDALPEKWHDLYRRELCKFPYLNVREQTGAEIIRDLTGRNADVVLDPTFMIDKDEWLSLAKPMPGFDYEHPYILYYFLGSEEEEISEDLRNFIDRVKKERELVEYRLFRPEDRLPYSAGPSEFLDLFNRAALICTDSFHGAVFSVILGKPFLLCNRRLVIASQDIDMSNRTISVMDRLQLQDKLPENQELTDDALWEYDYTNAHAIIQKEQKRMKGLLREAMRLA